MHCSQLVLPAANVGASCSISEAAEATSTKKADEEEAAEATSTKKADEEEIIALQPVGVSCSNVGDSYSISEAAEAANTNKAAAAAVPEAANTAVHEEGILKLPSQKAMLPKSAAAAVPRRFSPRLNGAVEGGDVTSPIRKHPKRK